MVKPRSKQASQKTTAVDDEKLEKLADRLVDKPYGKEMPVEEEEIDRITISVPRSMRYMMEDLARDRKRAKEPNRSVSAIARVALEQYFKGIKKYKV